MAQIQVPKLNAGIYIAPPAANVAVSKLVMYLWAVPGDSGDVPVGQGHVHTQIIVRAR